MKTILFQGDSITDTFREEGRGSLEALGQGYATMVAGELSLENPGSYNFVNRGISGNRTVDLYARIKEDMWNINPDVISLLIGVNDVLHDVHNCNGVDARRFEAVYSMIIEDTKKALPNTKIMLLEPFVAVGSLTEANWDFIKKEVSLRGEIVKKISEKHKLIFIPLQEKFDEATKLCDTSCWIGDGVHPTVAGQTIIKNEWIKAFKNHIQKD